MQDVLVIDAVRTPVGKFGGSLAGIRPDDLAALTIKGLLDRHPDLDVSLIEDVILGAANQAGEDNRNVARMALLLAKMPVSIPGVTVNRLCASGLQAIIDGYRGIVANQGEMFLVGGVESMTRAPFVMAKQTQAYGRQVEMHDTTIGWRFINPVLSALYYPYSMGETAENVAEKYGITREMQDEFAFNSQLKYENAHQSRKFKNELLQVDIPQRKGNPLIFEKDEHPRLSSIDQLANLQPAFKKNGTVTAGNSSGINDGASCLLLANEKIATQFNKKPLARIVSMASVGVEPAFMGIGPVPAVSKALKRANLKVSDIDLWEVNEAFAAQAVACIQTLEIDNKKVNIHGGSIAIGHPLGASGARISATLLHAMQIQNARFGVATMCVGVGQGVAIVYEKL